MILCALVFAADMASGEAREPKRRRRKDVVAIWVEYGREGVWPIVVWFGGGFLRVCEDYIENLV